MRRGWTGARTPILVAMLLGLALAPQASADTVARPLPFAQNWTATGLITTDDIWSGVLGIVGYRGDDLTTSTATDPRTILADGSATPVDVIANQTDPIVLTTGGVAEFDGIANPSVALQGAGTADAPQLVFALDTTGAAGIAVSYNLRDLDGSVDNAVQQVALQYRVGASGNFTDVAAGYVADATGGPSTATMVTPISVTLPPAADDRPRVEVRVMTTNAVGNDEWVGVDDIAVAGGLYRLTVAKLGAGAGTITGPGISCGDGASDCSELYAPGTAVALTATPASGAAFAGWTGGCHDTGPCNLTIVAPASVQGTFDAVPGSGDPAPTDPGPTDPGGGNPGADTIAPQTAIDKAPPAKTKRKRVKVEFSADEPSSTFECSLDGAAFAACSSPSSFKVKPGKHRIEVRARDLAGNADPSPAVAKFKRKRKR